MLYKKLITLFTLGSIVPTLTLPPTNAGIILPETGSFWPKTSWTLVTLSLIKPICQDWTFISWGQATWKKVYLALRR